MSQPSEHSDSTDDLQFTTAEPGDANATGLQPVQNCAVCGQPIESTYFAVGDKLLCPSCCNRVTAPPKGSGVGRFMKAMFMGLGAGLIGALIWFLIRRVAHVEVGLVAILVGFLVGKAVRRGSGGRGGRGYQVLAVLLTYCCIAANYMPDIFEGLLKAAREQQQAADVANRDPNAGKQKGNDGEVQRPATSSPDKNANTPPRPVGPVGFLQAMVALAVILVLVFVLSLAAPFFAGVQNIIGLLIISFALWEAWKFTAHRPLPISGPYQMGPRSAT